MARFKTNAENFHGANWSGAHDKQKCSEQVCSFDNEKHTQTDADMSIWTGQITKQLCVQ